MKKLKQKTGVNHVTKETLIGDIVNEYPQAAHILTDRGLHCVGCSVQYWESIENGFRGHGMPEETVEETVKELNKFISDLTKRKKENVAASLSLTKIASDKLKELISEEKDADIKGIRVQVVSEGCSGMSYAMDFEKDIGLDDAVVEEKGLKLIVDSRSMKLLNGTEITFIESLSGSGFKFQNPRTEKAKKISQEGE